MRSSAGSIQEIEKGKYYRCRVSVGYDPRTGKRREVSRYVRGSRRTAEKELARLLVQYSKGKAPQQITLSEFWNSYYMPDCKSRLRPNTVDSYAADFRVLLEPGLGSVELAKLTPAMIDRHLSSMPESRRRKAYPILRQALNKAVRWDMLESSPLSKVEPPKPSDYEPEVLSAEEARAYIKAAEGSPIESAILIAIGAGLRRSEIVALDWSDIQDRRISVTKGITSTSEGLHLDAPKSRFGIRAVYLPASIGERLEQLRSEGPVLIGAGGDRMTPDALSHRYEGFLNLLPDGVKRVSLKNLRHTSLTLAHEGGADILTVSRRGGHSNTSITSRYYLRPHEEVDKSAADGLDSLL